MDIPGDESSLLHVVGVDVGGTKIAAALVDARGGISGRVRQATDTASPRATLDSVAEAVETCIRAAGVSRSHVRAVGLGIPGLVDPERGIGLGSINLGWKNVPVRDGLQERLGLPCSIENDVKAAALGEAHFGAAKGLNNLVYLSIGTGIAAAVIIDHKIYRGSGGLAGEIGHAMLRPDGPRCKCGGRGCFEALASGPAIAARALQKLQSGRESLLSENEISAEAVYRAAAQGDPLAREVACEVGADVAFAIQLLALAYDPQRVVLGGGVSGSGDAFIDPIRHALDRQAQENWVFKTVYSPGFLQITKLGSDIGVLGAAALADKLG